MNTKFKSFTTTYLDNMGNIINEWVDKHRNHIDIVNWKCCGGDEKTTVIIEYYDYSEVNNDSI